MTGSNPTRHLLIKYLGAQRGRVTLLSGLVLAGIGLQLLGPRILGTFIDVAQAGAQVRELVARAATFLLVAAVGQAAGLAAAYLSHDVGGRATNALRSDLTLHCLRLDMGFHKAHTPGELIARIDDDVNALARFFSVLVIELLGNGVLAAGVLAALLLLDWRIGIISIAYVGLAVALLRALQQRASRAWNAMQQAEADMLGFLGERLYGTEDILGVGAQPHILNGLSRLSATVARSWIGARVLSSFQLNSGALVFTIAQVGTLGVGAWLYMQGRTTIGMVYVILQYIGLLREPISRIQRELDSLQRATASVGRIGAILNTTSRLHTQAERDLPAGSLSVSFDDVVFHYDDDNSGNGESVAAAGTTAAGGHGLAGDETVAVSKTVLDGISFHLPPGATLGLLGRTGSGKTTLTRLVFRLYDPDSGYVRLGDVDARVVRLDELRHRVGLVTQQVQIFSASLRDNLTLFNDTIRDEEVIAALQTLGLEDWYASLPAGLDTILQSGAEGLSAGQAQILALARVFLRDPDIIILDEASARLDPVTEHRLDHAISLLTQGRTAIIIAHRLSTVERADHILILEAGQVAEAGPRQTLAADPDSRYAHLLRTGIQEVLV